MMALFVGTAGWVACADASDPAHAACHAARDGALEARDALVTTDYAVVMRELKLRRALTTDTHFEQMGCDVLPAARRLRRRP